MISAVWRATDHRRMKWQNGGGTTREVATSPPSSGLADFDWRISLAEVRAGGSFSTFPGVDRILVLIEGPAMRLTVDGTRHEVRLHRPFHFDGAATTTCELPAGPTRDLNVMTRRGRCRAAVDLLHLAGADPVDVTVRDLLVLLPLNGAVTASESLSSSVHLDRLDAACWRGPGGKVRLRGVSTVAVAHLAAET
jgi:environmental stress-induced protein Ves